MTYPMLKGDRLSSATTGDWLLCSVIMVDEVHERTLATDILLGLLKKIQKRRPQLRVIISSATLEAKQIASFFDSRTVRRGAGSEPSQSVGAPSGKPAIISVEGRLHNVQVCTDCSLHHGKFLNDLVTSAEQSCPVHNTNMLADSALCLLQTNISPCCKR